MNADAAFALLAVAATYAVHSTVILGVSWAALRLLSLDPLVRSRAWRLALLGGLVTTTAQLAAGIEPLGGSLALRSAPEVVETAPRVPALRQPVRVAPRLAPALDRIAVVEQPIEPPAETTEEGSPWRRAVAWSWIAGMTWGVGALALRRTRFRRRLRDRLPVWDARAERLLASLRTQSGLRRKIRLTRSRELRVPATWGYLRPEICLPDRALSELDDHELEAVLAHELGHVVRADALWLAIQQTVSSVCFFQPLNRLARRGLARESEHLADAFAIELTGRPVALAKSLARVATWLDAGSEELEPAAASMAASRSALLERVERVLERGPRVRPNRLQSLPFVALPLLCIALAPSVAAESERPHERGERVLGAERDAAAPAPTRDVEGQLSPQDESVEALIESLRVELNALETHPRAASYREAFDAVRTRLDRLDELTDRLARLDELRAKVARSTPSPTTGDASAGRSFPSVPAPVTPSESVQ